MALNKNTLILLTVFLFPITVTTVPRGGSLPYAILLIMGLIYGWQMWGSLERWEKRVLYGFICFFIFVSLSLVNTQDIASGIKREGRYVMFPLMIPMYLMLRRYQLETGKVFLAGLFLSSVVLLSVALYQVHMSGFPRALGTSNPLIFGGASMFVVVIVACSLLTVANYWWHYLVGFIVMSMALSASVLSGAKGAWIVFPVVLFWLILINRKRLSVKYLLSIMVVGVILVSGALSFDIVKNRMVIASTDYQTDLDGSEKKITSGTVRLRLEMWRNSIDIWKKHPLLGTGIGDFEGDVEQMIEEGTSNLIMMYGGHAHNIYLDLLATAGLPGIIGLLLFVQILPFYMFYMFWIKEKEPWLRFYALSGMAVILVFAVIGLTEGWLARKTFMYVYIMSNLVFMSSIGVVKLKQEGN